MAPRIVTSSSSWSGRRLSSSVRTICWREAMKRVLQTVGRWRLVSRTGSMRPASVTARVRPDAAASTPTRPIRVAWAPRAAMLHATLPAPPGISRVRDKRMMGTGASGEMRSISPSTKRSSMTSPMTRTRMAEKSIRGRLSRDAGGRQSSKGSTVMRRPSRKASAACWRGRISASEVPLAIRVEKCR